MQASPGTGTARRTAIDTAGGAGAPPPLSAQLRAGTAAVHAAAERSPYLRALAGGRVTALGLAALLSRLRPVYEALESAAPCWLADPRIGRFLLPGLHRVQRLHVDLLHLTEGAGGPPTPASAAYAARIEQVARSSATGFVAHHYTRYLGDLSGGQHIRTALQRTLGAPAEAGLSFFAFAEPRPGALKRQYRAALDETPFTPAERSELLAEVLEAYRLNAAVTAELEHELPRWTTGRG